MIPPLIVEEALDRGINLIAITDHNASENIPAVIAAARNTALKVLPGIEVQTSEEVHVICLFDTLEQASTVQHTIDLKLPSLLNRPEYFGDQLIVTSEGDYIRSDPRLRLTSHSLTLKELFELVYLQHGLPIPAHVDRKANGLIEVLGLIPQDIEIIGLEVSRNFPFQTPPLKYQPVLNYPVIQSGDVHRLEDFLGRNIFTLMEPTIEEMIKALQRRDGRDFRLDMNPMDVFHL
jgi:PHP family Zn ribbon phosphoesterase